MPVVAFTAVVGAVTVRLAATAGHRVEHRSPTGTGPGPDSRLLSGQLGLTVRLVRPTLVAWALALAATPACCSAWWPKARVRRSPGRRCATCSPGWAPRAAGPTTYLGVTFLIVAVLLAFVAAGQVTAARSEESGGRLDPLLTRPVARTRWLGGRLRRGRAGPDRLRHCWPAWPRWPGPSPAVPTSTAGAVVRRRAQHLAPSVCVLGLGVLAYGVAPRAAAPVVYGVVAWSLLVDVVGGIGAAQTTGSPTRRCSTRWRRRRRCRRLARRTSLDGGLGVVRRSPAARPSPDGTCSGA